MLSGIHAMGDIGLSTSIKGSNTRSSRGAETLAAMSRSKRLPNSQGRRSPATPP